MLCVKVDLGGSNTHTDHTTNEVMAAGSSLRELAPYLAIAGQIYLFFQIDDFHIKIALGLFMVYQVRYSKFGVVVETFLGHFNCTLFLRGALRGPDYPRNDGLLPFVVSNPPKNAVCVDLETVQVSCRRQAASQGKQQLIMVPSKMLTLALSASFLLLLLLPGLALGSWGSSSRLSDMEDFDFKEVVQDTE